MTFAKDDEDNRFRVKLPWEINPQMLRIIELYRAANLMTVILLFEEQIDEMVLIGILRNVNEEYTKRYLPLNDYLLNGKIEMTNIFHILRGLQSANQKSTEI